MKIESFLNRSIIPLSISLSLTLERRLSRLLNSTKISYNDAIVLVAIYSELPTVIGPSVLARFTGYSRPRMSQMLKSLQHSGFVNRASEESDFRKSKIKITPKGEKAAYKLIQVFSKLDQELELAISENHYESMVKNHKKLIAHLKTSEL